MDKLLNFMDFACIDPHMYWRIPGLDGRDVFEIQWRRDDKLRWRIRKVGTLLWDISSETTLIAQLTQFQIDIQMFEMQLKSSLLQQVTYADRIVRDAKAILGVTEVEQAISDHKSFMSQLEEAITLLVKSPTISKPKLRIIKEAEESLHT